MSIERFAEVEIEDDGAGHGKVVVDGQDWSGRTTGFKVEGGVGDITLITLSFHAKKLVLRSKAKGVE